MRTKNLADLYKLPLVEWGAVTDRLDKGYTQAPGTGGPNRHSTWLVTINDDGTPHINGIGSLWHDDTFWFETGETSRKGRNLARDPRCSLSLATDEFDLVVEGTAEKITDPATVETVAHLYADEWPVKVDASGTALTAEYSAPSAGPPPWHVYRMTIRAAMVLAVTGEGGATRFDF